MSASTEGTAAPPGRICVMVPTYNERDNLEGLLRRLRGAVPAVDVLVVDDCSPDGTGDLADALARRDRAVHVLHRPGKEGLGRAYMAALTWVRQRGYTFAVQIDADGSHQPEALPRLLTAARHVDVVIGSRWVPGGAVRHWPWHRTVLSRGGNLFVRVALGVPVRDATAGFRVYRLEALDRVGLDDVASHGYCFQVDLTLRAFDRGLRMVEVPIEFVERERGTSKMGTSIVLEALVRVTAWGVTRRTRQVVSILKGAR
ncbi:MAG TPA: polyprenol monophosphomannose synthase [Ornithinimicrobium sp.]|uniref:polyprenol monophosphomannose synthase n=1 Tax=Ornithinimicrobium sp. TaxID=1977084 RepID=UPI002B49F1D8|nr:polyprenol monophosphomannose synthase [Ornithinimicrobium sp.]HKJ11970.1 polyprenol monophosphomannose synthase [Ornithinimicrobium sp.]